MMSGLKTKVDCMNYYQARELQDENGKGIGKFHYTVQNDNRIWPVGYCSRYLDPSDDPYWTEEAKAEHRNFKDKYHGPEGHDSKLDACNCYREYELDRLRFYDERTLTQKPSQLQLCQMPDCENYTASCASVPGRMHDWILCTDHLNRESVEILYPKSEFSSFGSG